MEKSAPGMVKDWVIEHALVARPDQIPRIKALGVKLSMQPHLYYAAPSCRTSGAGSARRP